MTEGAGAAGPAVMAREIMDRVRYLVLGTVDADGRPRTSPVYFVPHGYQDLYWVSDPASHHSRNLAADHRLGGVIFDSTVRLGRDGRAVYVTGTAREVPSDELAEHLPNAFDPGRGARAFTAEELTGDRACGAVALDDTSAPAWLLRPSRSRRARRSPMRRRRAAGVASPSMTA